MAKIFKVSGYLIDECNDMDTGLVYLGLTDSEKVLWQHLHIEQSEIDSNDFTIHNPNCDLAECEKYFKSEPSVDNGRTVEVGATYHHFKGNRVKVLLLSQETENVGSWNVVYESLDIDPGKIWSRPLDMFLSEVDHKMYPAVKQKYRFEKVDK